MTIYHELYTSGSTQREKERESLLEYSVAVFLVPLKLAHDIMHHILEPPTNGQHHESNSSASENSLNFAGTAAELAEQRRCDFLCVGSSLYVPTVCRS